MLAGVATGVAVVVIALLVREQWPPLVLLDERAVTAGTALAAEHPGLLRTLVVWQWIFLAAHVVLPVAAFCFIYWWRTRNATRTWWALSTILAAWGLSNLLKELVGRARPVLDQPVESAGGFSFPSGHAANTAAMTTALVVLVWPSLRSRALRVAAVAGAAVLTVATAVDRVMLGVHYPSDVVAGILFGVGFVLASYLTYRHWSTPPREPDRAS
ncbi:phosphatase PAP2 family protein [Promicromonospora soli]|uniref:Phosphatase PAP2 family protein n=1 Tax=Promicromonospora soli TaxID=2035533 RepID=A0A919KLR4_9MICO|nr:phosphatase PAP2 family protein [Promicromonospora soli]